VSRQQAWQLSDFSRRIQSRRVRSSNRLCEEQRLLLTANSTEAGV